MCTPLKIQFYPTGRQSAVFSPERRNQTQASQWSSTRISSWNDWDTSTRRSSRTWCSATSHASSTYRVTSLPSWRVTVSLKSPPPAASCDHSTSWRNEVWTVSWQQPEPFVFTLVKHLWLFERKVDMGRNWLKCICIFIVILMYKKIISDSRYTAFGFAFNQNCSDPLIEEILICVQSLMAKNK